MPIISSEKTSDSTDRLQELTARIHDCSLCPRLSAWREEVAAQKVRRYATMPYWGKPVSGFGDPGASLVIIGLAPGAHGANRTGRVFTGDASGEWLYAALHKFGWANQRTSTAVDDGLVLKNAYIANIVRCVPPDNRPDAAEIAACAGYFAEEMALLQKAKVYLVLGQLAFVQTLRYLTATANAPVVDAASQAAKALFSHGAHYPLPDGRVLLASYHPSQQNTRTGRLTATMWDVVFERAWMACQ